MKWTAYVLSKVKSEFAQDYEVNYYNIPGTIFCDIMSFFVVDTSFGLKTQISFSYLIVMIYYFIILLKYSMLLGT